MNMAFGAGIVLALTSFAQPKPFQIGIFGEVEGRSVVPVQLAAGAKPGAALKKAIEQAKPRAYASTHYLLCRKDGKIEEVKAAELDNVESLASGDMIYVPAANEAVILHEKKAFYVIFDGQLTVPLKTVLIATGIAKAEPEAAEAEPKVDHTKDALVYPRFLQRFQSPDLVEAGTKLQHPMFVPMPRQWGTSQLRYEAFGFIELPNDTVQPGDVVVLKSSHLYSHIKKVELGLSEIKQEVADESGQKVEKEVELTPYYYREYEPKALAWRDKYGKLFGGASGSSDTEKFEPIASETLGVAKVQFGETNARMLTFGRFESFAPGETDAFVKTVRYLSYDESASSANFSSPHTLLGAWLGTERMSRTEAIAFYGKSDAPLGLATNLADRRKLFKTLPTKFKGMRLTYRVHPLHAANFFVQLDLGATYVPKGAKPKSTVLPWAFYEQDALTLEPSELTKSEGKGESKAFEYYAFPALFDLKQAKKPLGSTDSIRSFTVVDVAGPMAGSSKVDSSKKAGGIVFRVKKQ